MPARIAQVGTTRTRRVAWAVDSWRPARGPADNLGMLEKKGERVVTGHARALMPPLPFPPAQSPAISRLGGRRTLDVSRRKGFSAATLTAASKPRVIALHAPWPSRGAAAAAAPAAAIAAGQTGTAAIAEGTAAIAEDMAGITGTAQDSASESASASTITATATTTRPPTFTRRRRSSSPPRRRRHPSRSRLRPRRTWRTAAPACRSSSPRTPRSGSTATRRRRTANSASSRPRP